MNLSIKSLAKALTLGLAAFASNSCETTGSNPPYTGYYDSVGFGYDPWYYGSYDNDPDLIVTPPNRPDRPLAPTHPIARPPMGGGGYGGGGFGGFGGGGRGGFGGGRGGGGRR